MTLGNQILMFQERNVKCFYINTPRLTKDQRVSICLEYPRVNNARDVIPAALGITRNMGQDGDGHAHFDPIWRPNITINYMGVDQNIKF